MSGVEMPVYGGTVVTVLGVHLYAADPLPDHRHAHVRSFGGVSVDASVEFGIFLWLLAAAGIGFGGYRAMQEEGTSFGDAADRLSGGSSRRWATATSSVRLATATSTPTAFLPFASAVRLPLRPAGSKALSSAGRRFSSCRRLRRRPAWRRR